MPRIQYSATTLPGVPRENAFYVLDDSGMRSGNAAVVEYVNHQIFPDRPLNYYVSINALDQRSFDVLMGAVFARAYALRARHPKLPARIYAPCQPQDVRLLQSLSFYGFLNDDAVIRVRRVLSQSDRPPTPPVGCSLAPVVLEDEQDFEGLLARVNAYSVTVRGMDWLNRLRQEQLFAVLGVWQEQRLLGEIILTAYGAEGRVEMIYTRPEARRRGVATALLSHAGELLLRSGIRTLTAEVWRRNVPAMTLFNSRRFDSIQPTILYPGRNV